MCLFSFQINFNQFIFLAQVKHIIRRDVRRKLGLKHKKRNRELIKCWCVYEFCSCFFSLLVRPVTAVYNISNFIKIAIIYHVLKNIWVKTTKFSLISWEFCRCYWIFHTKKWNWCHFHRNGFFFIVPFSELEKNKFPVWCEHSFGRCT